MARMSEEMMRLLRYYAGDPHAGALGYAGRRYRALLDRGLIRSCDAFPFTEATEAGLAALAAAGFTYRGDEWARWRADAAAERARMGVDK